MSEVGNLGIGSMENSQACYLGLWTHIPYRFLPPESFEF